MERFLLETVSKRQNFLNLPSLKEFQMTKKQAKPTRYLDLTKDMVFKYFFKKNTDLLIDLIQQFLPQLKNKNIKIIRLTAL